MGLSYRKMVLMALQVVMIMVAIFIVATPESGVECRPLLLQSQGSREVALLFQSLPNGPSPPSSPDPTHGR
ncbi:hypothetical protein HN51_015514 [Arachis hypogaea]